MSTSVPTYLWVSKLSSLAFYMRQRIFSLGARYYADVQIQILLRIHKLFGKYPKIICNSTSVKSLWYQDISFENKYNTAKGLTTRSYSLLQVRCLIYVLGMNIKDI